MVFLAGGLFNGKSEKIGELGVPRGLETPGKNHHG